MMLAAATVFLLMETAQAIYHIKMAHRHNRHKETAQLHKNGGKSVTQPGEIKPYIKFLHSMVSDYSGEGVMTDPSGPLQNIQTFKASKSARGHKRRPRRNRYGGKRHEQQSVLVKFLRLPIDDPRSLKMFTSLPQPDAPHTIAVITDTDMKGISRKEQEMANKLGPWMRKEVSLLIKYLTL